MSASSAVFAQCRRGRAIPARAASTPESASPGLTARAESGLVPGERLAELF